MTRILQRMTAAWLAAAFVVAAFAPLADTRHALFDDLLCVDPGKSGAQSARLRTVTDAASDDHCAVCHLQRAVRHAAVSAAISVAAGDAAVLLPSRTGLRPQTTFVQYSSSRAPPRL